MSTVQKAVEAVHVVGPEQGADARSGPRRAATFRRVERRAPGVYAGRHQPQTAACEAAGGRRGLEWICIVREATCDMLSESMPI